LRVAYADFIFGIRTQEYVEIAFGMTYSTALGYRCYRAEGASHQRLYANLIRETLGQAKIFEKHILERHNVAILHRESRKMA
jgi:hypothetical protein